MVNFDRKYLVNDILKAKCGATIRVELIDAQTGVVVEDEISDLRLEMYVLDANLYDTKFLEGAGAEVDLDIEAYMLLLNKKKSTPLLVCGAGGANDAIGKVLMPINHGKSALPDLHVTDSSEAILSGRKPPFRLLVRALLPESRPKLKIRHAISEGFVVATRRTRTAGKVDIPSLDDHVSKLEHMGKETVKKLQDIRTAAVQAGIDIDIPDNCILRVGDFKMLSMRAELQVQGGYSGGAVVWVGSAEWFECGSWDGHLRQRLQHVLKLSKEKWEEARDHAMRAVAGDGRMRAWYADRRTLEVGLLFATRLGCIDLDRPVALLQHQTVEGPEGAADSKVEATLMAQQTPAQRDLVRQLQPQAAHSWWLNGHPGWAIFPMDSDQFLQGQGQYSTHQQANMGGGGMMPQNQNPGQAYDQMSGGPSGAMNPGPLGPQGGQRPPQARANPFADVATPSHFAGHSGQTGSPSPQMHQHTPHSMMHQQQQQQQQQQRSNTPMAAPSPPSMGGYTQAQGPPAGQGYSQPGAGGQNAPFAASSPLSMGGYAQAQEPPAGRGYSQPGAGAQNTPFAASSPQSMGGYTQAQEPPAGRGYSQPGTGAPNTPFTASSPQSMGGYTQAQEPPAGQGYSQPGAGAPNTPFAASSPQSMGGYTQAQEPPAGQGYSQPGTGGQQDPHSYRNPSPHPGTLSAGGVDRHSYMDPSPRPGDASAGGVDGFDEHQHHVKRHAKEMNTTLSPRHDPHQRSMLPPPPRPPGALTPTAPADAAAAIGNPNPFMSYTYAAGAAGDLRESGGTLDLGGLPSLPMDMAMFQAMGQGGNHPSAAQIAMSIKAGLPSLGSTFGFLSEDLEGHFPSGLLDNMETSLQDLPQGSIEAALLQQLLAHQQQQAAQNGGLAQGQAGTGSAPPLFEPSQAPRYGPGNCLELPGNCHELCGAGYCLSGDMQIARSWKLPVYRPGNCLELRGNCQ
eukprot:gene30155-35135_t